MISVYSDAEILHSPYKGEEKIGDLSATSKRIHFSEAKRWREAKKCDENNRNSPIYEVKSPCPSGKRQELRYYNSPEKLKMFIKINSLIDI